MEKFKKKRKVRKKIKRKRRKTKAKTKKVIFEGKKNEVALKRKLTWRKKKKKTNV